MSALDDSAAGLPPEVDATTPSVARVYDYALGGKDNFAVDRAVIDAVEQVVPEAGVLARDNRAWLIRMTRFLSYHAGITQYLDLGSGLPAAENTHQVAQRVNRDARVVYVDNDPAVLAYGRALLEENELTKFVSADLAKPDEVLSNETVRRHLDWSEPLALYQVATLHHYPDAAGAAELMRTYIDALPSGSYVALSHFFDPGNEHTEKVQEMHARMAGAGLAGAYFRTREQIEPMLAGLELVEPGLVAVPGWWPDGPQLEELAWVRGCVVGAVGRKP